jgi:hypothetical protein
VEPLILSSHLLANVLIVHKEALYAFNLEDNQLIIQRKLKIIKQPPQFKHAAGLKSLHRKFGINAQR